MPVDTFMLSALAEELSEALEGSRVDKIHMPARDEVHILGRSPAGNYRLLISGGTRQPRVHLSQQKRDNPASPPMFCMLLRKHLVGGRFVALVQPHLERVLRCSWDAADEMGIISRKTLVCEMMGRHSNIILVDADGRILDCLRRVDYEMSPERPVLPGLLYRDPPRQDKKDPLAVTRAEYDALRQLKALDLTGKDWLLGTFAGLSPQLCADIDGDPERFFAHMNAVKAGDFTPILWHRPGKGEDVSALRPLNDREGLSRVFDGTFSELLDRVYTKQEEKNALANRAAAIRKQAANQRDRLCRKLALQQKEWAAAQDREPLRECADLLMANLHRFERGCSVAEVEDFYNGNQMRRIPLDPTRSPQQNAALYYKRYAKAKTAQTELQKQMAAAERDIEYWESVLEQISRAESARELTEIQEELHTPKGKQKPQKLMGPHTFVSGEGIVFRAGRNNRQNDVLTMKTAGRNDIWMHAQKIPGCHVIIDTSGGEPGELTLYEAASVAALYSGAKNSPKVTVDYTRVKYVKKPVGARPGFVIYDRFKSLLVAPDPALAERLRDRHGL